MRLKSYAARVGAWLFLFLPLLAAGSMKLKVTADLANIRSRPDIGSSIVRQLPQGAILEATGKEGEWYLIKLKPDEEGISSGYVHESLVQLLEEQPQISQKVQPKKEEPEKEQLPQAKPAQKPSIPLYEAPKRNHFALGFFGGGGYTSVGDLNSGADGFFNFYSDLLGAKPEGRFAAVHVHYLFGGELSFILSSRASVVVGADYFRGKRESAMTLSQNSLKHHLAAGPEIRVFPLRLFFGYRPFSFTFLKIGVEYSFAECRYLYRLEWANISWQQWQGKAKAQGLGAVGSLGLEWEVTAGVALVAEVGGRFSRIKGFEGTSIYTDSLGLEVEEEGKLYFYQVKMTAEKVYDLAFVRSKRPSEAGVINPREAELDLSGASAKLGIKFKF